jgi:tRNA(fMet)-specific endonuclease VapC
MSFLLDTDIASFAIKQPSAFAHRFMQHSGRLYIASISLGELYVWAFRRDSATRLHFIESLESEVTVLNFDRACAMRFAEIRAQTLPYGVGIPVVDLMIGAVTLVHDLTLVTHNTSDFAKIPALRLDDWT